MLWIVAATGESLTPEVAEQCRGHNVIAVNDAYKLMPFAHILYGADNDWWMLHKGCPGFAGEKWSTYSDNVDCPAAAKFGLHLIRGRKGYGLGFSFKPGVIHYGGNSGFQAVNLALQRGADRVIMVGFDMRGGHFFGDHPPLPRRTVKSHRFMTWARHFEVAAELLPAHITIINCTEGSALGCFPIMPLTEALNDYRTP